MSNWHHHRLSGLCRDIKVQKGENLILLKPFEEVRGILDKHDSKHNRSVERLEPENISTTLNIFQRMILYLTLYYKPHLSEPTLFYASVYNHFNNIFYSNSLLGTPFLLPTQKHPIITTCLEPMPLVESHLF